MTLHQQAAMANPILVETLERMWQPEEAKAREGLIAFAEKREPKWS